jgi:hypothetical protein
VEWWADKAGVIKFARARNVWDLLRGTRYRFQEFNRVLAKDDPARGMLKVIADALRADLGFTPRSVSGGAAAGPGQMHKGGEVVGDGGDE